MNDSVGAFLIDSKIDIATGDGPLSKLRFGVKDVFDIEGYGTGCGNPDWARTHPPATSTAPVVRRLLDAGAALVGKTVCDELAFSLNGQNMHHGTPRNSRAPDRLPGGSSSGSAAAVAAELVDFALGTDTAGSVRVPASYCGLFGIRPTHGLIDTTGVTPLAARFDTVGWFARSAELLQAVGSTLLGDHSVQLTARMLVAEDVFSLADPATRAALMARLEAIATAHDVELQPVTISDAWLVDWQQCFSTLQARQIWQTHGEWITKTQPTMAPDIAARFEWTSTIDATAAAEAEQKAARLVAPLCDLLDGAVLWLPTVPGPAPLLETPAEQLQQYRSALLRQTSLASLAGLPQITMPVAEIEGCPVGLSLIGSRESDLKLLQLAIDLGSR